MIYNTSFIKRKNSKKRFLLIFFILFFFTSELFSQDSNYIVKRNNIVFAAGSFSPGSGNGGTFLQGGYYYKRSPVFFIGGDIEFSEFSSTVFSVENVGITSIAFQTQIKYLVSEYTISPYIGGGMGYSFKIINESDVHKKRSNLIIYNNVAQGIDFLGLIGVIAKVSDSFYIFIEGKYSVDLIVTQLDSQADIPNLGGAFLLGGILILF